MSKLVPTTEAAFVPDEMPAQLLEHGLNSNFPLLREQGESRESERHFRMLLEGLPAAVYTTDAEGRITYYNEAAASLWGHRPELGKSEWCGSWKLFWPDGTPLPHDKCPMALALKERVSVRGVEAIAERPDGSRVPFMPYPTPLFDAAGALTGAINMLVDLTGRKHAEAALRASETRLSAELEATQHLQAVSTELVREQDADVLYDKLVEAAARMMRSDYASMQMLYPERGSGGELRLLAFRGFNPQAAKFWEWVRADSESTCGAALRTGRRVIAPDVNKCDFMVGTEDLETYLQTGIHAVQTTPLVSRSGRLLGMISTHWRQPHNPTEGDLRRLDILARQAADLIERAQTEAALRQSEARLSAIVNQVTVGIAETDLSGRFQLVNRRYCDMLGYSEAELTGMRMQDITHPDDLTANVALFEKLVQTGEHFAIEKRYRRKDGSTVWVRNSVSGMKDVHGRIVNAVAVSIDITERKRWEEQRTLLLKEMNHRVKNLFAVTSGVVRLSANSARTPEDLARNVRGRLDALARAHDLVLPSLPAIGPAVEQGSTLKVILQTVLSPYADADGRGDDCVVADGPAVKIGPNTAGSLALVLHELATNAVKYGALSVPQGRVYAGWSVENGELSLTWTERDGPPIKRSMDEGFGSRLTGRSASQLGGRLTRDWRPEGLIVRLSVPIDRLAT